MTLHDVAPVPVCVPTRSSILPSVSRASMAWCACAAAASSKMRWIVTRRWPPCMASNRAAAARRMSSALPR
jgi:hypothetical protein